MPANWITPLFARAALKVAQPAATATFLKNRDAFGFIDRTDLARLIVGALDDDESIGKTYHAADESRTWIFQ